MRLIAPAERAIHWTRALTPELLKSGALIREAPNTFSVFFCDATDFLNINIVKQYLCNLFVKTINTCIVLLLYLNRSTCLSFSFAIKKVILEMMGESF